MCHNDPTNEHYLMSLLNFFTYIKKHKILAAVAILLVGGSVYWYLQSNTATQTVAPLKVTQVKRGDIAITVSGSGQVAADAQVDLKPVAAGEAIEVLSVAVKNDQAVQKGQVIAILDNEDARRSVAKAELDVRKARIQEKQVATQYNKKTVDDTRQRQLQEVTLRQSEIALADAVSRLDNYTIRAPFAGIVTGLSVEGGDTVSQTTLLASVITKNMKVEITLNEVDVVKVTVGTPVTLTFDALGETTLTGKITKLDTIGTTTQGVVSYGAEITLDIQDDRLKPAMSATANILVDQRKDVLLVPASTINEDEAGSSVLVQEGVNKEGTLTTARRRVEVGLSDGIMTEIVSGLKEGEKVVETGATLTGTQTNGASGGNVFNMLFRGNTRNNR